MRQSKTVNGVTTEHIYSGMNVVQEKEGSNLKATYHRMGNQVIYSEVNGNRNFYIYNAQGNVSKLLNSEYETVADYAFDAFGVQKMVNGEVYNPFRHNGEYYDEELGYTYLRNRYYDNVTGRFITEDPIKDGLNWYVYTNNNPVMFVDMSGLGFTLPDYNADGDERLEALQALTDDTLGYDMDTGLVVITNQVSDPTREIGTNLVRELIADPTICTINYTSDNNSYMNPIYDENNNLIEAEILYNPNLDFSVLVKTDSGNQWMPETNYIVMGHELVNFYNRTQGNMDNMPDPNGNFKDPNNNYSYKGGTYYVQDENGIWYTEVDKIEELRATGIVSYRFWIDANGVEQVYSVSPGKYSENALRQEQLTPLPIRVKY